MSRSPKSEWHYGRCRLLNQAFIKRRGRALGKALDWSGCGSFMRYRPAVLNSLFSGIMTGQMERGDLTGQDCVSLHAYTCINITWHNICRTQTVLCKQDVGKDTGRSITSVWGQVADGIQLLQPNCVRKSVEASVFSTVTLPFSRGSLCV